MHDTDHAPGATTHKPGLLDPQSRRLLLDGHPVPLGERAFDLLIALARSPGRPVPTERLLDTVWPGRVVEDNNLHVHMAALRRVLGADAIRTVRGQGYQLTRALQLHEATAPQPLATQPPAASARLEGAGNLSPRLAPLIGRAEDLLALQSLLRAQRSVTLIGPAGVGKTTLAKTAALGLQDGRDGLGAWMVELAGVADGAPVAEAVARALGVALPGLQSPQDELVDLLRQRSLLLLLDNCEHRAKEVARLATALLQHTEGVRLLATSQVALQHAGEQLFRLLPLALPPFGASAPQARASGAVALFCARLQERFFRTGEPADDEARLADVVAICEGLDGLPLALELAAARVPLLGLAGVRQRLGEQLKLLSGGPRDAPARQQTLRAAIQWSHALLDERERQALRRLGVFAGSFTLHLAQQVISDPAPGQADALDEDWAALDLLQGLLDKSLIVHHGTEQAGRAPRLRLLESTRSFAREKLRESGEQALVTERLAQALLRLFSRGDGPRDLDPDANDAEARAPELDNLRAALDALAAQPGDARLLIDLTGASAWIWSRLALRAEGLRRCSVALARVDAHTPAALEARLQLGWVSLAHRRGEDGDIAAATRAAALYQGLGDRLGRFRALSLLAFMLALEGREAECNAALEDLAESFDPNWGLLQWGAYHWTLGASMAQFDRWDEVRDVVDRATQRIATQREPAWTAAGWLGLAQVFAATGEYATAVQHGRAAVALLRQIPAKGRLGLALGDLASYLVETGALDEALPLAREAVALRGRDGSLGLLLDQLARLASVRGRLQVAAMALGRADAHHARRNGRRDRYLNGPMQRAAAAVAQALSAEEAAAWRVRGAAMGDDEIARLTVSD